MTGLWLVATTVLGRPVPVTENPHVCTFTVFETRSGQPYRYQRRDCPACAARGGDQK
jgi:hypothetical protein